MNSEITFPVKAKLTLAVLLILTGLSCHAQKIASLEVNLARPASGMKIPVSINLDEITYLSDTLLALYETRDGGRALVPFQIEPGNPRKMTWMVTSGNKENEKISYELRAEKSEFPVTVKATVRDGALLVQSGEQKLLQYIFKTVYPPAGVDTAYRRSGFIHPLWSPHGQELTRIQPPDHYHHYGIWNPWTMVEFEGDTLDFWNINSKQATVRFANFVSVSSGPVFSGFEALHEHVVLKRKEKDKVAMNELQGVTVYEPDKNNDCFIVDFNINMNCAGESPFRILEYRYAGLGWRTTQKWDKMNSMVLTSEGKDRKSADGSKAKWCIVQGQIDDDYAGVVMMSFPTNYNFPEPLRIWPENQYNRGDMFANFCPTKDMNWDLMPGRNYNLRYRFLVFNGRFDREKAESAWYYFANPPRVSVRKQE